MKNCECTAEAELFDLTTGNGHVCHQVVCSDKCGRETAVWCGSSSVSDALDAWAKDKITILYTVTYLDEKMSDTYQNTFSSFTLEVAARFGCFLLQNNIPLISLNRRTPYDETTTLWGYSAPEHEHSNEWLFKAAGVEMKECSCGNVTQQNSDRCASTLCKG